MNKKLLTLAALFALSACAESQESTATRTDCVSGWQESLEGCPPAPSPAESPMG